MYKDYIYIETLSQVDWEILETKYSEESLTPTIIATHIKKEPQPTTQESAMTDTLEKNMAHYWEIGGIETEWDRVDWRAGGLSDNTPIAFGALLPCLVNNLLDSQFK